MLSLPHHNLSTLKMGGFMNNKSALILSVLMFCFFASNAQRNIRGIVSTSNGENKIEALSDVLIFSYEGNYLGSTNDSGKFDVSISNNVGAIYFSQNGLETDTLNLKADKDFYEILMRPTRQLKEVVIQSRKKSTEIGLMNPIKREQIGERELMKAACCNLSESFETTPSVDVAFTDAVSGYKQIQMLGLAGPYTLITRENIPDTRGLAATTGLTFTPGTWIEGMQLSKGTGGVVNGYESVAGQINVEWKKAFNDKEPTWLFNLYQSTQGRTEGNVVWKKKLKDGLHTNLFFHGKSNWYRLDQNSDGFMDQPIDQQWVLANRWFWFSPNGWEFQAGVKGVSTHNLGGQLNYESGKDQIVGNPWGYELSLKRLEFWSKLGHVLKNKPATSFGWQLSGVLHHQTAQYGTRNYKANEQSIYSNFIYQTIINNTNHVLKLGSSTLFDIYDEHFQDTTTFQRNEIVPGIFTEYSFTHGEQFNLVAGIRGDYHNLFGAFLTPRVHIRYAPFKSSAFRFSFGRAQRTANFLSEQMGNMASNRVFQFQSTDTGKSYAFNPEVAWNTGLNFTQKFMLNYRDGSISIDYYYTHFDNQVVVDLEDPKFVKLYNLNGNSFANSFQIQIDYELIRKLDLRIAYRWFDVRTTYDGQLKEKPLIPAHRAFANIGYETRNNWKFDYTVQWIGNKRVPVLNDDHLVDVVKDGFYSPSYWQMNAQISKDWKNIFELYVGIENIENIMMHHPVVMSAHPFSSGFDASMPWGPIMGRNIYFGLRMKLK